MSKQVYCGAVGNGTEGTEVLFPQRPEKTGSVSGGAEDGEMRMLQ